MKGSAITLFVIIVIAIILFAAFMVLIAPFEKSAREVSESRVDPLRRRFTYDYSNFVIDPEAYSEFSSMGSSGIFCERLKSCVLKSNIMDKSCEIGVFSYGEDFYPAQLLSLDCPDEELVLPITTRIQQDVCKFSIGNLIVSGPLPKGYSDSIGLSYRDCTMHNSTTIFGPDNYAESTTIIQEYGDQFGETYLYYSPDYFSTKNYPHDSSDILPNLQIINDFYLSPGRARMVINDSWTDEDFNCKFNIMVCPIPYIGDHKTDNIFGVFDAMRTLPVFNMSDDLPYYVSEIDIPLLFGERDVSEAYRYNTFKVSTGGRAYDVVKVINSVKFGLYENYDVNNHVWAHPHWDIRRDTSLSTTNCWSADYDTQLTTNPSSDDPQGTLESSTLLDRTRSILYNCGDDDSCTGDIIINVVLRRDHYYVRSASEGVRDIPPDQNPFLSGIIAICGE